MEALARPRLSASDWVDATLEVIAEYGLQAVAVESLAKRLHVTKGSFYWHFPTRDALLDAALAHWSSHDTGDLIARVQHIVEPAERLRMLFRLTSRTMRMHRVYSALLRATDNPLVARYLEEISSGRVRLLTQLFRDVGLNDTDAALRAQLAYAAYVGFLQLALQVQVPRMSTEQFDAYVEHVIATFVP